MDAPVGIIDLGSNSVRLVVYDGLQRTPIPLFNEKAVCGLGRGLEATRHLNHEGAREAAAAVGRFAGLARSMGINDLTVLATAAVRDAEDGPTFVRALESRFGIRIKVLSGADEARLSALGVLCGVPDAKGLVADLGGGSLELVRVGAGAFGEGATLPLGALRLQETTGGDRAAVTALIDSHLARLTWLTKGRGRNLYAVGGVWRSIARICIEQLDYPLHVLDNFTLPRRQAEDLIGFIARLSGRSLEKIPRVSKKRVPNLPVGALVLGRLLETVQPDRLIFSIYGMREGQFFSMLPEQVRRQDPLISTCAGLARAAGRFPEHGAELMTWMAALFRRETKMEIRCRLAACLLSDIFWSEHPDYRAEQAFLRTLRLPYLGLEHRERAGLALAVFHRYEDDPSIKLVEEAAAMLDTEQRDRVMTIGYVLRLAHTISGGAPGILSRTQLVRRRGQLVLSVPAEDPIFLTEVFEKRLDRLARHLGLSPAIVKR